MLRFFSFLAMFGMISIAALADDAHDQSDGCTIEIGGPLFSGNSNFKLNHNKSVAHEHVELNPHVQLYVEQSACEYLTTVYTFVMDKQASKTDIEEAEYQQAIKLLSLVEQHPQTKNKTIITKAKNRLIRYLDLVANPKQNQKLYLERTDYPFVETVSVSGALRNDPVTVKITISSGPY